MTLRRGVAIAAVALVVATALTGCIRSDRYAALRDELAADPAVLFVEGSDSSMPDVTNVSSISANIDPGATTADIQRVAEIVRAELEPLSDEGPDPRVMFELGAPSDDLDVRHPRLEISEFTIDESTLAAEIAYWRELDAATDGAASGFTIEFPVWGTGDYERSIGVNIAIGLPATARIDTFRTVADVPDPTGAGTHWSVSFAPESFVMTNQNRDTMQSRLGLPTPEVLELWDRTLEPLPSGGQPAMTGEWSSPAGESLDRDRLTLHLGFPDDPESWDRLVEVTATALGLAETVWVTAGAGEAFGVYVSTDCDDGQVIERNRERDRSDDLIAALGAEGERLGICEI